MSFARPHHTSSPPPPSPFFWFFSLHNLSKSFHTIPTRGCVFSFLCVFYLSGLCSFRVGLANLRFGLDTVFLPCLIDGSFSSLYLREIKKWTVYKYGQLIISDFFEFNSKTIKLIRLWQFFKIYFLIQFLSLKWFLITFFLASSP